VAGGVGTEADGVCAAANRSSSGSRPGRAAGRKRIHAITATTAIAAAPAAYIHVREAALGGGATLADGTGAMGTSLVGDSV